MTLTQSYRGSLTLLLRCNGMSLWPSLTRLRKRSERSRKKRTARQEEEVQHQTQDLMSGFSGKLLGDYPQLKETRKQTLKIG